MRRDDRAAGELRRRYRRELRRVKCWRDGARLLRGFWEPDERLPLPELASALRAAASGNSAEPVKQDIRCASWKARLLGRTVFVKRYAVATGSDLLKYAFRVSRARRYWAAARSLVPARIGTPRVLGYLEVLQGFEPVESFVVTQWCELPDARHWLERERRNPRGNFSAFRRKLWASLAALYQQGIYHRDTKLSNLLVDQTDDELQLLWTDIECLRFGAHISLHCVVRNLVQLNGSLPSDFPRGERRSFLELAGRDFPALLSPRTVRKIHRWTDRRLRKEQRTGCGP
ncbi:MAG TPA: hypothetical protein EYP62_06130 [Kiritimatiellae bacterium]|nr:hypothetical protein [Kiritimatiellia bacterium]